MTIEQLCRDLLDRAIMDKFVEFNRHNFPPTVKGPQDLFASEVMGMANMVSAFLADAIKRRDERWQAAVGKSLEAAEEDAAAEHE